MFHCSYAVISALAKTAEEVEFLMNLEDYMDDEVKSITWLFTYCKGGSFNIHIWVWFGYFIC